MKLLDAKSKLQENQFYGSDQLLDLFQQLPKLGTDASKSIVHNYLNKAYKECDTIDKKQLFYSIIFMTGEISNRNHNIFKIKNLKNVENGGTSLRKVFIYSLEWMLTNNKETENQFYQFLPLIGEYTNNQNSFFYQLRTDRKKGSVLEVIKLPINIDKVTNYISSVLKDARTTDATRALWAKFLPRPDFCARKRVNVVKEGREESVSKKLGYTVKAGDTFVKKADKQDATREKEYFEFNFILSLSSKMDWETVRKDKYTKFVGFNKFKTEHLFNSEATLFSQKRILEFTKDQFISWLDKQPSGARYRIQRRLFNIVDSVHIPTEKWVNADGENLATWFKDWEAAKVVTQKKLLSLTDEEKAEMAPNELKKLQKAAKVNTGAETLVTALLKIKQGNITTEQAKLISQSILNKIKCEVPVFMWVDVSSSMSGHGVIIEGVRFTSRELSAIALTAFLLLNPLKNLGNIFGVFSTNSNIVTDYNYSQKSSRNNQWLHADNIDVKDKLLIDHTKSFYENYLHISQIISGYPYADTNIAAISKDLKKWVDSDPTVKSSRIEMIQQFPVHLYISDCEFNNCSSPGASLATHRANMKQWFGWDGLTVLWDVKEAFSNDGVKFRGIPNTMYFGNANPGTLSQIFENMHDLDIVDDFAPLLALYRTVRYSPVRELTIGSDKVKISTEHSTIAI